MRYVYRAEYDLSLWFFDQSIDKTTVADVLGILRGPKLGIGASRWFADLSLVERIDIDFDTIADFARFDQRYLDVRVAVRAAVLVSTQLAYGVVRMYQSLKADSNIDLRIFYHRNECGDFLDLPPNALLPIDSAEQSA